MSLELTMLSLKQSGLSLSEHAVLNVLAIRANESNECWPSTKSLKESCSADRKTILKVIQSLTDKKLIIKTGEMKGRTLSVPVYKLTLRCPVIGIASKKAVPFLRVSSPKNGTAKQSQKRDMERSVNKSNRKEVSACANSTPKPISSIASACLNSLLGKS